VQIRLYALKVTRSQLFEQRLGSMIHRYRLMPKPHKLNRNSDMVKAFGACRELAHPSH
jgi:hypothetical protein